jgi:hypothetical protein
MGEAFAVSPQAERRRKKGINRDRQKRVRIKKLL